MPERRARCHRWRDCGALRALPTAIPMVPQTLPTRRGRGRAPRPRPRSLQIRPPLVEQLPILVAQFCNPSRDLRRLFHAKTIFFMKS